MTNTFANVVSQSLNNILESLSPEDNLYAKDDVVTMLTIMNKIVLQSSKRFSDVEQRAKKLATQQYEEKTVRKIGKRASEDNIAQQSRAHIGGSAANNVKPKPQWKVLRKSAYPFPDDDFLAAAKRIKLDLMKKNVDQMLEKQKKTVLLRKKIQKVVEVLLEEIREKELGIENVREVAEKLVIDEDVGDFFAYANEKLECWRNGRIFGYFYEIADWDQLLDNYLQSGNNYLSDV